MKFGRGMGAAVLVGLAACASPEAGPAPGSTPWPPDDALSVEWIWRGGEGSLAPLPQFQWLADGRLLLWDLRVPEPQRRLEALKPETGERRSVLDLAVARQSLAAAGVDRDSFQWPLAFDESGRRAVELIDGDVFVLDLDTAKWTRLTRTPQQETGVQFAPDGAKVSYVRDHDLYFYDLIGGQEHRLTTDGAEHILNGSLSWVYWEEIFGRRDIASWWSPDSSALAFLQTDESQVEVSSFLDTQAREPRLIDQRYPRAGGLNPSVRVGVVRVEGAGVEWVDLSGVQHEYLLRVQWLPDHRRLALQVMNREQTQVDLWFAEPGGSAPQPVLRETDEGWVNLHDDLRFLEDGEHFLWQSERSGFAHLYLHRMDGSTAGAVTRGDWAVRASGGVFWMRQAVAAVDEPGDWVYFTGHEHSPLDKQLYRVHLDGSGMQRISREPGTHRIHFRPDGAYYLDSFANRATPPSLSLRRADGSLVEVLAEAETEKVAALHLQTPRPFEIPARDGFAMPAQMLVPPDFDPGRRYPVVLDVYGGPSAPTVANDWEGSALYWDNLLLREGCLVVKVDNRSATAISKALENTILESMYGDSELNDLLDAVAWLKQRDWVDPERVGLWGWSGGGTFTLLAMTRSQEFRAGVAVAAVTDWRDYDSKWAESVMKSPQDNPDGYHDFDLNARAADLSGRLLLVHGTYDDNVHPIHCWRFVDALIAANKRFELMMYPMRKHGITDPAARVHLYGTMLDFWRRELLDTGRSGE